MTLFEITKFIHILSVFIWTGGIIFTIIVNRELKKYMDMMNATKTLSIIGKSIQLPMRISLILAIISGIILLILRKLPILEIEFYKTSIGKLILIKYIVVLMFVLILPYHSKIGKSLIKENDKEKFKKLRNLLIFIGWIILILSILAMYLGTKIRYGF
ncbi:MAG: hypothetical protein ABIL49_01715 [candidate division WOR-3 bacterium]